MKKTHGMEPQKAEECGVLLMEVEENKLDPCGDDN
jgi:hypothetical protein